MLTRRVISSRSAKGFSLFEVLIALSIIAILSAVLIPSLNSQIGRSNATRAANDLVAIQTAVQAFIADMHRAPSTVTQLTTKITTSPVSMDLANPVAAAIPDYLVANWRGPYLTRDVLSPNNVGTISDDFSVTQTAAPVVSYLTVTMTGVALRDMQLIEELLDEGGTAGTSSSAGSVRWVLNSTTLSYLAVPLL